MKKLFKWMLPARGAACNYHLRVQQKIKSATARIIACFQCQ